MLDCFIEFQNSREKLSNSRNVDRIHPRGTRAHCYRFPWTLAKLRPETTRRQGGYRQVTGSAKHTDYTILGRPNCAHVCLAVRSSAQKGSLSPLSMYQTPGIGTTIHDRNCSGPSILHFRSSVGESCGPLGESVMVGTCQIRVRSEGLGPPSERTYITRQPLSDGRRLLIWRLITITYRPASGSS